jgi:hypothetical protein
MWVWEGFFFFFFEKMLKGLCHSIETFEGVFPGAALKHTSPLHLSKSKNP